MAIDVTRLRRRYRLPTFEPGFIVRQDEASFDRLKISFPRSSIRGMSPADVQAFFRRLNRGELFRDRGQRRLVIQNGWHLAGELRLRQATGSHPVDWSLSVVLDLNLARFIGARGLASECIGLPTSDLRNSLRLDATQSDRIRNITLDQNDNMVPGVRLTVTRRANWSFEFGVYVRAVLALIAAELRVHLYVGTGTNNSQQSALITDWSGWTVRQVEVFWEFGAEDAVSRMTGLQQQLIQVAPDVRTSEFNAQEEAPAAPVEVFQSRGSRQVSVPLGVKGLTAAVYPKQRDRLRFEVRYNSNVRAALGGPARSEVRRLQGRSQDLAAFAQLIALDASWRLNRLSAELANVDRPLTVSPRGLAIFLFYLTNACQNEEALVTELLTDLLSTGRLDPSGSVLRRSALEYLEQRGVLRRPRPTRSRRAPRVYHVTSTYQGTIDALQAALSQPRAHCRRQE